MTVIDCNTCPARGRHCGQCFVPVVAGAWLNQGHDYRPADDLGTPVSRSAEGGQGHQRQERLPLTDAEWEAVDAFIGAGLVNALDVLDLLARSEAAPVSPWQQVG